MKKSVITILLLVASIGGFLIFFNPKTVSNPTQNNSDALNTPQKWESKVDDQASVTVTVTPSDLRAESGEWKFDIVMSTHSVELDQDMTKVAVLVADSDKEYRPIRWEGTPAGGHHREGVLIFASVAPYPQDLKLNIKEIGGVQRSLSWILVE
ncbi:MAG: hypothetical protein AAB682_01670 [Patescibacteria group bacterium]|mgnify:FL=1